MTDTHTTNPNRGQTGPPDLKDRLLAEYGAGFDDPNLSDEQKAQFLLALWTIMQSFVDLGFSVKSGDKLHQNADLGIDDVLQYLITEETAPETVAPPKTPNNKEPL